MRTLRMFYFSLAVALLGMPTPWAASDTVQWSGLGVPDDSWEVGGNWIGGAKPTASDEAFFDLGTAAKTIYLNANQTIASLRKQALHSQAHLILRGTTENDTAYSLTLAAGDISVDVAVITLYAPVILGDANAVWTVSGSLVLEAGVT